MCIKFATNKKVKKFQQIEIHKQIKIWIENAIQKNIHEFHRSMRVKFYQHRKVKWNSEF